MKNLFNLFRRSPDEPIIRPAEDKIGYRRYRVYFDDTPLLEFETITRLNRHDIPKILAFGSMVYRSPSVFRIEEANRDVRDWRENKSIEFGEFSIFHYERLET